MKTVEKISEAQNYTAISVGEMSELNDYKLVLSPEIAIPGKVFIGNVLNTTGSEISFQSFAPNTETGFLHTHKNHEELYFFIKGRGEFQVDNNIFAVSEGSVVRVAPNGRRSVRNNGVEPLVMICVQYKSNTFGADDAADGVILNDKVEW